MIEKILKTLGLSVQTDKPIIDIIEDWIKNNNIYKVNVIITKFLWHALQDEFVYDMFAQHELNNIYNLYIINNDFHESLSTKYESLVNKIYEDDKRQIYTCSNALKYVLNDFGTFWVIRSSYDSQYL